MIPSTFKLVPCKPRSHSAIHSATWFDLFDQGSTSAFAEPTQEEEFLS